MLFRSSHFSGDHNSSRGIRISESLRRVEYTETAGELGALLLELKQIKSLRPLYNRRSRAAKQLVSIELSRDDRGYLRARLVREIDPQRLGDYYGLFRSKRAAEQALQGIAARNELCNRLLGLESGEQGPCFQRSLGRCQGACDGGEDIARYNLRMQIAFHSLRLTTWPWSGAVGIVERSDDGERTDILVIYNWVHVTTVHSEDELHDLTLGHQSLTFDLDSYKLVVKSLMGPERHKRRIIELTDAGLPDVLIP